MKKLKIKTEEETNVTIEESGGWFAIDVQHPATTHKKRKILKKIKDWGLIQESDKSGLRIFYSHLNNCSQPFIDNCGCIPPVELINTSYESYELKNLGEE